MKWIYLDEMSKWKVFFLLNVLGETFKGSRHSAVIT